MAKKKVCIVGGGATGAALLWMLAKNPDQWDVTLIHNQDTVGGHSLTKNVPWNGGNFPIDVGVQFISPMLYPNVHTMLKESAFSSRVPVTNYNSLRIACAFPRNAQGNPVNWGNFPAYQTGPNFALYTEDMKYDANVFQNFLEFAIFEGWGQKTLKEYFDNPPQTYRNKDQFVNFFLAPYLSIINGYGAALMDQTLIVEIIPLFATIPFEVTPLGSFTKPGVGWQRFTNGAGSWVQAMVTVAQTLAPSKILLNTNVLSMWSDPTTGKVTVTWKTDPTAVISSGVFDKVVLTTDMWTNSKILNNPQNQYYWTNLYKKYIGYGRDVNMNPLGSPVVWDLMWGQCFIHTDSKMLSPDLMQQQETLQFNAYYASTGGGKFDLLKTYTTYIQKNVLNKTGADGLYLTMYGYIPSKANGDTMPDPSKVIYTTPWTHGKWTPAFMGDAKKNLHLAQGLGNITYPGQMNTNIYFAGNNTTTDSEEGALDAAIAIAEYAFGGQYPFNGWVHPLAHEMYNIYKDLMFPAPNAAHAVATRLALYSASSPAITSAPAKKKTAVKKAKAEKKRKPARQKTKKSKSPSKPAKKAVRKVVKKKKTTRKGAKSRRKTVSSKSKR